MMNSVIDTSYNKSVPILGQTQTNGELTSTSASPLAESLMTNKDKNRPPKSNGVHSLGNESPQGHRSPSKNTVITNSYPKRGEACLDYRLISA